MKYGGQNCLKKMVLNLNQLITKLMALKTNGTSITNWAMDSLF